MILRALLEPTKPLSLFFFSCLCCKLLSFDLGFALGLESIVLDNFCVLDSLLLHSTLFGQLRLTVDLVDFMEEFFLLKNQLI